MNLTIKAIKTVQLELLRATNDADRSDASVRLCHLHSQLSHEVMSLQGPQDTDYFLVNVGDQPSRVIGKLEHGHLSNWCSRKGLPLTSVRVDESMVNMLLEVI